MATTRQSIKTMIRSFTTNGKPFCYSNYSLAKKLDKAEKTTANTISMMKKEGEIDVYFYRKVRYLKLRPKIKNIIPDSVKRFYAKQGIEKGQIQGTKSGTSIYNINISKAKAFSNKHIITESVDMILVADIKKEIPNFKSKVLEKLVCDVNNEKLIRKYLKKFIENLNPSIENPAGLFTNNLREILKDFQDKKAAAQLEPVRKEKARIQKDLEIFEIQRKQKEASQKEIEINNNLINYYKNNDKSEYNDLKNFVFNSRNYAYMEEINKYKILEELQTPKNLSIYVKSIFNEFISC